MPTVQEPALEDWRRRYLLFPRLLFVLDGTGPTGAKTRIRALRTAARDLEPFSFLHDVPVPAAPLTDLLRDGPPHPSGAPYRTPPNRTPGTPGPDRRR
ncbi:hypothetical protein [Streptomyces umbrinus]|uniref:hypothetical protein n=1 Tax=Streptomyces umbrinus TaxID=67370 RepID=UPI0033E43D47